MYVYILNKATNGKLLFAITSARSGRLNQSDGQKKQLQDTTGQTDKVTYWGRAYSVPTAQKVRGLGLSTGSGTRFNLRFMLTATDPSSTNLTFFDVDFVTGPFIWGGIGRLRKATLNLIMNMIPPRRAPWGPPFNIY